MSWLDPLKRTQLYGIIVIAFFSITVTYGTVRVIVIQPLRDQLIQQKVSAPVVEELKKELHQSITRERQTRNEVEACKNNLKNTQATVAALQNKIADSEAKIAKLKDKATQVKQLDTGLSPTSGSSTQKKVTEPLIATAIDGEYKYQRTVGQLRVRGYGKQQVEVFLETIANQLSSTLTFTMVFDNKEDSPYELGLLDPENNAVVVDNLGNEYNLTSSPGISDVELMRLEALSRKRVKFFFSPVKTRVDTINFRAVFNVFARGSLPSKNVCQIEVRDIRMKKFVKNE